MFRTAILLILFSFAVEAAFAADPPGMDPVAAALAQEKARQETAKAMYEAMAAASNAKKAADLASAQASIGVVTGAPAGSPTGAIELVGASAGKTEATLLSAHAVTAASKRLVSDIGRSNVCNKTIVIVSGYDGMQFPHYQQYKLRERLLTMALAEAHALYKKAEDGTGQRPVRPTEESGGLTEIGVAVDALSKLGSYFQTDYKVGGVDLTPDNQLLVSSVVNRLIALNCSVTPVVVARQVQKADLILAEVAVLQASVRDAAGKAIDAASRSKKYKALAEKNPKDKEKLLGFAKLFDEAQVALERAIASYQAFLEYMGKANAAGVPELAAIVQEQSIYFALYDASDNARSNTYALQLATPSAGGAYYTKRNLWTIFGTTPFYVMGGVVTTYSLIDPSVANGKILASDIVVVHGGYSKINDIPEIVEAPH